MTISELANTIQALTAPGKGILAADESTPTITKRFASINVESTETNRRDYRETLFSTPGLGDFISGVILFEETLGQDSSQGKSLPALLNSHGIVPGIKVDKGLVDLPGHPNEKVTQGLDGLANRLRQYKEIGARFAKWRAVYTISATTPSRLAMTYNAENLARYAALCQNEGIVPIVEPEVLLDGDRTIERRAEVIEVVLHKVFHALHRHSVSLEHIVLKPSMVVSGKDCSKKASIEEAAKATVEILNRTVPAAVPTINFLSGGQTPEEATAHLNFMNQLGPHPWMLSFSYGRALQEPCLKAWAGEHSNVKAAQDALFKRSQLNSAAVKGEYNNGMEEAA